MEHHCVPLTMANLPTALPGCEMDGLPNGRRNFIVRPRLIILCELLFLHNTCRGVGFAPFIYIVREIGFEQFSDLLPVA